MADTVQTLEGIATTIAETLGVDAAKVSEILDLFGPVIAQIFHDKSVQRQQIIASLGQDADAGFENAAQQLWNWANRPGTEFPHGFEPLDSVSEAASVLETWQSEHPVWAADIHSPGGKNGDPQREPGGPTFK